MAQLHPYILNEKETFGKIKMTAHSFVEDKKDWESLAACIRSEQLSAKQIVDTFRDNPEFASWYIKTYSSKGYQHAL